MKKLFLALTLTLSFTLTAFAAQTIDGKDAEWWGVQAMLRAAVGRLDEAMTCVNNAITLDPGKSRDYNTRGLIYYQKSLAQSDKERLYLLEQAKTNYDKAIELDPKSDAPYTNRGNIFFAQNDYQQALADYNKSLTLESQYPANALFGKAQALDALNRKKEARAAYQDYLNKAPANDKNRPTAQNRLAALK